MLNRAIGAVCSGSTLFASILKGDGNPDKTVFYMRDLMKP